jgi:hypothetical protein
VKRRREVGRGRIKRGRKGENVVMIGRRDRLELGQWSKAVKRDLQHCI